MYFSVCFFVFTCIVPTIAQFSSSWMYADSFVIPLVRTYGGCIAYMLFGHFCYSYVQKKTYPLWLPIVGFLSGFALNMIISLVEFNATAGKEMLSVGEIEYLPLLLESISMFAFLLKIDYASWIKRVVDFIAPLTFGIYLISDFLCGQTHLIYYYLCIYMNRLFAVAIQDIAVLALGVIVIWLIRKIPFIRKYV